LGGSYGIKPPPGIIFLAQIQHVCTLNISITVLYNSVPTKGRKTLPPETFPGFKIPSKCVCGRGSDPNSTRELTALPSTPPDPLVGLREARRREKREGERSVRKWSLEV